MKSIIYARISTNSEKQNIEQQINYCKDWALKNNYEVLKVFKDKMTGKTNKRKGFQRMINYLKVNPIVSLIVQDTDRLSRDFYDGVEFEKFIRNYDINIISLSEKVDLKSSNGRFMFRIKLAMNNYYVENLVDKIRVGVARAKIEGKYKGRKKGAFGKKRKKKGGA